MKWNLRLAAAQRDIWKSSELHRMLADAGLEISAGKMSNLWAGQPVTIRLDDLEILCEVLGCTPNDLLVREPEKAQAARPETGRETEAKAVGETPGLARRYTGRTPPPV
ncbi:helix-turn-helix transcriptional regulator [Streptomyces sp. NBC_01005]|uniref:helix-turn-helix domain-containing protein n=1 Tax=unclassified Streptomyces TaxID=2593676 RepID=UPI00386A1FD4|nr:helix-turn-helix transcriptional regulator [Streptomyces sp. NBC_01005]WTC99108.1 helix-turn-helix transcriptional regulator [Streptomyces sp. NBC_01650]